MPSPTRNTKTQIYVVLSTYYSVLALFLLAAFFPQYRIWGINWWAYYPGWVPFVLFAVGAMAPLIVWFVPTSETGDNRRGKYFIIVFCLIALYGLAFYFLRAGTHFLGDGYQILSILASDNPFIKPTEYGEALVHLWVYRLLGGEGETSALLSYQIVSISVGILFLIAVAVFAKFLFERTRERVLFLLGLASSGYMLLFFGYVENYSLFVLSVAVYSLMGLLVIKGKINRLVILPLLALSIFFHVLGITLIPSAVYLLVAKSKFGDMLSRLKRGTKVLTITTGSVLVLAVFYHFYSTDYFFRFAFLPFVTNRFTVEGYTLFSFKHIVDYFNLLLLLLPGLPLVVAILFFLPLRRIFKQREYRYLLILVLSTLGAVFIFDPKLGMPRDWDLFSFCGVPLAVFGYFLILSKRKFIKSYMTVSLLSVVLAVLVLLPRATSQAVPETSLAYFKNYLELDRKKNRTGRKVLIDYYKNTGQIQKAQSEKNRYEEDFPEVWMMDVAERLLQEGSIRQAADLFRQAEEENPIYWNAWAGVGICYKLLGKYDSALLCLKIADGLNPYNPIICSNMAHTYYYRTNYKRAEKLWLRALAQDSLFIGPLAGLAVLYRAMGDQEKYAEYFMKVAPREDAPVDFIKALGDLYLSKGLYDSAANAYQRALKKGLDSSYYEELIEKYPQLKK